MVHELTADTFKAEVLDSTQPVMVDFFATWCSHCKTIARNVDKAATEYGGKVKVCKIDVDKFSDIADRYKITGLPTLALFKKGKVSARMSGMRSISEIREFIDEHSGKQIP